MSQLFVIEFVVFGKHMKVKIWAENHLEARQKLYSEVVKKIDVKTINGTAQKPENPFGDMDEIFKKFFGGL